MFLYAEKLHINHNIVDTQKRSTMAPSGYKELTEKEKRAALGALLVLEKDGELPHGSFAQIGKKLALAPKSIARLWRVSVDTRNAKDPIARSDIKEERESSL